MLGTENKSTCEEGSASATCENCHQGCDVLSISERDERLPTRIAWSASRESIDSTVSGDDKYDVTASCKLELPSPRSIFARTSDKKLAKYLEDNTTTEFMRLYGEIRRSNDKHPQPSMQLIEIQQKYHARYLEQQAIVSYEIDM